MLTAAVMYFLTPNTLTCTFIRHECEAIYRRRIHAPTLRSIYALEGRLCRDEAAVGYALYYVLVRLNSGFYSRIHAGMIQLGGVLRSNFAVVRAPYP